MQAAQRTDVDETLDIVPQHTIDNILRTADSSALMVVRAALHRSAYVVDNFRALHGAVHGGRISQIAEKNLDVGVIRPLRFWLPSNEEADTVPVLQESPNKMP